MNTPDIVMPLDGATLELVHEPIPDERVLLALVAYKRHPFRGAILSGQ